MTQAIQLYKVANDLLPLLESIDEDGCIPDDLAQALAAFEGKGLSVAAYILNCSKQAEMIHQAAMDMDVRAGKFEKRAESLKTYLRENMKRTGITEINSPEFSVKLYLERDSKVEILDEKQIPIAYMKTPDPKPVVSSPDKKLIAADIKLGKDVPGARIMKSDRLTIL
jgi:hypothetical protein